MKNSIYASLYQHITYPPCLNGLFILFSLFMSFVFYILFLKNDVNFVYKILKYS